jgi:pyridoxamine 5'-phosphate oxidase
MVLLKAVDDRGFSFFTNYESVKGQQISQNAYGSMLFYWASLERQIRIEGSFEFLTAAESDSYFASRPRGAQLGAIVSKQSRVVASRRELEAAFSEAERAIGSEPLTRPAHWGGYRLVPTQFEFWQGRESRLHDRVRYLKTANTWVAERLWP